MLVTTITVPSSKLVTTTASTVTIEVDLRANRLLIQNASEKQLCMIENLVPTWGDHLEQGADGYRLCLCGCRQHGMLAQVVELVLWTSSVGSGPFVHTTRDCNVS